VARKKKAMITMGADPEFFVRRIDTGAPHPICGLLGGTKASPRFVGNFGLQEDNVMAEYNIPPTSSVSEFSEYVTQGRNTLLHLLNSEHDNMFEFDNSPSRLFPTQHLQNPQAQMFGCSPDFDAYMLGAPNPRIQPVELERPGGAWRFCGGHIHIGYKHFMPDLPEYVAAMFCDLFLGLGMVCNGYDSQGERRRYYGTPGRFRPTAYGLEYRTLSNRWTTQQVLAETAGYYAAALGTFISKGDAAIKKFWAEVPWQEVRRAITEEQATLAHTLIGYVRGLGMEEL
jgi:hypothetical protein